jgi:hypothetical protein
MPIAINAAPFSARALPAAETAALGVFATRPVFDTPASMPPPGVSFPPAAPPLFSGTAGGAPPPGMATLPLEVPIFRPPFFPPRELGPVLLPPQPFPLAQPKTTTQLARGATAQLGSAPPAALTEAINAVRNRRIEAPGLMTYLERKTPIRSVMESLAKDWAETTRNDFADAFQMAHDHFEAMDAIVSLAILNDDDLEEELLVENTPQTTPGDLMENRRVVWQYPAPGTVLQPPYVVLVAVEYRDVASAQDVVRSIMGELGNYQGFKLPKAVIQRLG